MRQFMRSEKFERPPLQKKIATLAPPTGVLVTWRGEKSNTGSLD